jgi:hypothetical protein
MLTIRYFLKNDEALHELNQPDRLDLVCEVAFSIIRKLTPQVISVVRDEVVIADHAEIERRAAAVRHIQPEVLTGLLNQSRDYTSGWQSARA